MLVGHLTGRYVGKTSTSYLLQAMNKCAQGALYRRSYFYSLP
jgi:hypothetical protein